MLPFDLQDSPPACGGSAGAGPSITALSLQSDALRAAVSGCGRIGSLGHFASAVMSKQYKNINSELASWIAEQRMFFVATAPLSSDGHLNLSPKGGDAFRVLGPLEVVYQDYTGSGVETVAHIRENGRIVIMFCAFAGSPKILRLHGHGTVLAPGDPRFTALESLFPANPGTRAFIHIAVTRVVDSCGWAVPVYDFRCHRDTLDQWAAKQGPDKLDAYRATTNQTSIDGLPAFNRNA
jgi:hypothetical protein